MRVRSEISMMTQLASPAREEISSSSGALENWAARSRHSADGSAKATSCLPRVNPRMMDNEQTPIRSFLRIMLIHPRCRWLPSRQRFARSLIVAEVLALPLFPHRGNCSADSLSYR